MNKSIILFILILIFLAVGILVWQSQPTKKVVNVEKEEEEEIIITKLENCIEASSLEDYYEKKGYSKEMLEKLGKSWTEKTEAPIEIPSKLTLRVKGLKIYQFPINLAGIIEPVVVYNNKYCELTEKNYALLFAPIEKDNVIDYLLFAEVALSRSHHGYFGWVSGHVMLKNEDYDKWLFENPNFSEKYECSRRLEDLSQSERRLSRVEEINGQYVVSLVYCSRLTDAGCYESEFIVAKDGSITKGKKEKFIECKAGIEIMF